MPNASPEPPTGPLANIAIPWFDAEAWERAKVLWPDLLEELPEHHLSYSHTLERRIKRIVSVAPEPMPMAVTAVPLDAYIAWCDEHGHDPGSGEGRAAWGAEAARRRVNLTPWPPSPNDPCWCQSGLTYERCCGPEPAEPFADGP